MDCYRSRISGRNYGIFDSDPEISSYDYNEFMVFLKEEEGLNVNEGFPYNRYFAYLNRLYFIAIYLDITWAIPCHSYF